MLPPIVPRPESAASLSAAMADVGALDTVMARLLLAARPRREVALDWIDESAPKQWLEDPVWTSGNEG